MTRRSELMAFVASIAALEPVPVDGLIDTGLEGAVVIG